MEFLFNRSTCFERDDNSVEVLVFDSEFYVGFKLVVVVDVADVAVPPN